MSESRTRKILGKMSGASLQGFHGINNERVQVFRDLCERRQTVYGQYNALLHETCKSESGAARLSTG